MLLHHFCVDLQQNRFQSFKSTATFLTVLNSAALWIVCMNNIGNDGILQDERFDRSVDELTGYRTKSVMCLPITHSDGRIIGVAQAINKGGNSPDFTYKDHQVFQYNKLYNKELREIP